MAMQRFKFAFTRDDGTTFEAATDPLNFQQMSDNIVYTGPTYVNDQKTLDGNFGKGGLFFTVPTDGQSQVNLFSNFFGEALYMRTTESGNVKIQHIAPNITEPLKSVGLTESLRDDGCVHLWIEFKLNHFFRIFHTELEDHYTVPTGFTSHALIDFGYVPFDMSVENTNEIGTIYLEYVVRRLLGDVNIVPDWFAAINLDLPSQWTQLSGNSQDPMASTLVTTCHTTYLASPY